MAGSGALINSAYTRLYANDGTGAFTLNSSASFTGIKNASVAWGDYDNDGYIDLAISGVSGNGSTYYTKVYRNNTDGTFTDSASGLAGSNEGMAAWGDFDLDKRLDLAVVGRNAFGYLGAIYQNTGSVYNTAPTAPFANSTTEVGQDGEVTFSWTAATDTQTPAAGLSYNIRIGTASVTDNVVGAMSSLSGTTIYRRVPAIGNAQKRLSVTIKGLQASTNYRWAVQAIDSAYAPSAWSNERLFSTVPMISGRVMTATGAPMPGVLVDAGNGYTATTDSGGYYKLFVFKYWTGTATASKAGCSFDPASHSYTSLTAHQFNQDFTGTWTGYFTEVTGILQGLKYRLSILGRL